MNTRDRANKRSGVSECVCWIETETETDTELMWAVQLARMNVNGLMCMRARIIIVWSPNDRLLMFKNVDTEPNRSALEIL